MCAMQTTQPIKILIVEDNPADVFLTREALNRQGLDLHIESLTDGERALNYLSRAGEYAIAGIPDLIILDLNVPKIGGPELLRFIRRTPELRHLCVVILSSSPHDVIGDDAAQASCYIQKPATLREFLAVGEKIIRVLSESKTAEA
jgi:two-component system, chemotaxis family, response regulator Rcp1